MKAKERIIRDLQKAIARKRLAIEQIKHSPVNLIIECFPQARANMFVTSEVDIWLPFDFELIETVKQFIQLHTSYTLRREYRIVDQVARHTLRYEAEGEIRLEFHFSTNEEGTTCVLNQVGTKIIEAQEVPVYEVICFKGAEEGGF
jgi:hypothetical protein